MPVALCEVGAVRFLMSAKPALFNVLINNHQNAILVSNKMSQIENYHQWQRKRTNFQDSLDTAP